MNLDNPYGLSPIEIKIAKCITRGASAYGCAQELYLSQRTVEHYLRLIYKKLRLTDDPLLCKRMVAAILLQDFYGDR